MIDIDKLARKSGASFDRIARHKSGADMWVFSQNELQLYTEKVMLSAQAAERERSNELVEAIKAFDEAAAQSKTIIGFAGKALGLIQKARKALAKYEVEK